MSDNRRESTCSLEEQKGGLEVKNRGLEEQNRGLQKEMEEGRSKKRVKTEATSEGRSRRIPLRGAREGGSSDEPPSFDIQYRCR